jgi:hypothetical protein
MRGKRVRTIKKLERAFSLYEQLKNRSDKFAENRGCGRIGIAVDNDYHAKEWQKLEFRLHFLRCYLKGEKINWFYARWLSNDEADSRNKTNI